MTPDPDARCVDEICRARHEPLAGRVRGRENLDDRRAGKASGRFERAAEIDGGRRHARRRLARCPRGAQGQADERQRENELFPPASCHLNLLDQPTVVHPATTLRRAASVPGARPEASTRLAGDRPVEGRAVPARGSTSSPRARMHGCTAGVNASPSPLWQRECPKPAERALQHARTDFC